MINILHTIDTTGPGGAETVFLNIINGLDKSKYKSTVAICGKGWVHDQLAMSGLHPLLLSAKGSFNFLYLMQIISMIRKHRIHIIHSHLLGSNVYCSLAGLICRVPVISTFHGFVDMGENEKMSRVRFALINKGSSHVVFVSNQLKTHFINKYWINPRKAVTIYNGIDLDAYSSRQRRSSQFRQELGLDHHHILIGSIGNIRRAKGYDYLLMAAAKIVAKHPECKFVIAGEGSGSIFEDLLGLRARLDLDDKVLFVGFRNDIIDILHGLDIFVLPSISEGFSIATIEAMACHKPVIVTRSGGPEEIVNDGNGIMVSPGQADELASAIIRLIENQDRGKICIENAYNMVQNKFSKQSMLDQYMQLYDMSAHRLGHKVTCFSRRSTIV